MGSLLRLILFGLLVYYGVRGMARAVRQMSGGAPPRRGPGGRKVEDAEWEDVSDEGDPRPRS